jgi:uncharacterized membrane protein YraQ (UPF0718 family)
MNSLLASTVGFLNAFLALVFIIGGALIGKSIEDSIHYELGGMGLVFGLVVGLILAIIICGVLAIFISMRNELIAIRRLLAK